jgi:hypothetical protein
MRAKVGGIWSIKAWETTRSEMLVATTARGIYQEFLQDLTSCTRLDLNPCPEKCSKVSEVNEVELKYHQIIQLTRISHGRSQTNSLIVS